ncbi:hypothetical protein KDM41_03125 [bacterium]|nr:hypothetical protein [bacterium]
MRCARAIALLVVLLAWFGGAVVRADEPTAVAVDEAATPSWEHVRVVDVGGWEYRDVTIRWVEGGGQVELMRADGAVQTFAPDRIARVYAADGREITAEVAAGRRDHPVPAAPSPRDPVIAEVGEAAPDIPPPRAGLASPPLFRYAVDAALGYATHTGGWFQGLDDGMNLQLGLRVNVGPQNYVRFLFRRQDFGSYEVEYDFDLPPATIEVALNEYLVMFGRHGRVVDNVEFRSVGYFEIGLTAMEHRFRETVFDYRESETKIGLAGNGGFMLLLDENLAFDLSGSLTLKPGFTDGTPFGLLMGGHLGLVAFF